VRAYLFCRMSVIHRTGFLIKQGEVFKSWKKRYFVLSADALLYYVAENKDLKGEISMAQVKSVNVVTAKKPSFSVQTEDREYIMQAETESERDEWIKAINQLLKSRMSVVRRTTLSTMPAAAQQKPATDVNESLSDRSSVTPEKGAVVGGVLRDSRLSTNSTSSNASSSSTTPATTPAFSQYIEMPNLQKLVRAALRADDL
jgi:hypothetical protein